MTKKITYIKPQIGYQTKALACSADILISGGSAGPGKTFGLLLESLRHTSNPKYTGVIFRRTGPQIRSAGGLWQKSNEVYRAVKGDPKETTLEWSFPSGAHIKFSHLEYEKNIYDWQGSEITFIGFDELCHMTEKMFFYLLSRNRSTSGIRPYVRCTCNPDPDSWVAKLIQWWWCPDTGLPIKERDGVIRYFIKYGEDIIWGDTYAEVTEKADYILKPLIEKSGLQSSDFIKSITFINGDIYENKILLATNPEYLGNLLSQDEDTRRQLLEGNWKQSVSPNDIYDYAAFQGAFDNVKEVNQGRKYITADIAMKGSNKLVIWVWDDRLLIDVEVIDKSDGKQVIDGISALAQYWGVQNRDICYDSDGVGSYIDGFIKGALPFNGGLPAIEVKDPVSGKKIKENYFNLKTQCYYRSGKKFDEGEIKISEHCANKMYDSKMTIRQRMMHERKCIKRDKVDNDGKLRIIPKEEMKVKLGGESPDLLDALMQRELFDLKPVKEFIA